MVVGIGIGIGIGIVLIVTVVVVAVALVIISSLLLIIISALERKIIFWVLLISHGIGIERRRLVALLLEGIELWVGYTKVLWVEILRSWLVLLVHRLVLIVFVIRMELSSFKTSLIALVIIVVWLEAIALLVVIILLVVLLVHVVSVDIGIAVLDIIGQIVIG